METLIACDSSVMVDYLRNYQPTLQVLHAIGFDNVVLPSVTVMEIIAGARNRQEWERINQQLRRFAVLHFDERVSPLALDFIRRFQLSKNVGIPDALIAATAIANDLELYTRNRKHFDFLPGIRLYKP